jgi:glycosyltransferase involved in cell wall biosynthesis
MRDGAPGFPILLFTTTPPNAQTAALCEYVEVSRNSLALLFRAQHRLWRDWVAMGVVTWTGARGSWPLKLAPFLIPPFRALVLNDSGDFFQGTPPKILGHAARRVKEQSRNLAQLAGDFGYAYWRLLTYHIWLSGPVTRVKDEVAGFVLLLASIALRAATALMRWSNLSMQKWFDRLHGDAALTISAAPDGARGSAWFHQNGPHWNGRKFEDWATGVDARWIVWQQDSEEDAPFGDMLPLFDDPRTFAVSRQAHFRAWKPMLFPLAPFRTLQPGEASHVLAPLSSTIVIDRRKLEALGIPRCSLAGAAWMLLFWKAAAAGWRSYSVGQQQTLCEQPDFPMQETSLLLRFMLDHRLRELAPREPELSRGSIAFSAARPARSTRGGRLKVLVVAPFLPYPLSHGGAVRMFHLCGALSERVDFALVAMREARDVVDYDRLDDVFREVYIVDKDERPSRDERLPDQVRQHQSQSMRAMIAELARDWRPDLLQIEYTHLAGLRDAAPDVPALLVEHDLTFSLYRQLAQKKGASETAQREYERWRAFEQHWLGVYEGVWTVSEEDRVTAIAEGSPEDRTFTIPNGVDLDRFGPGDESATALEVFYVGSFRHLPNVLGFQKLRDEVMPRVWSRFPEARLRVVAGPQHEMFWQRFAPEDALAKFDGRIEMHGFVEDLRPLYARASVVVVPLEVSAGTNIKVLEAMACGKALVTTPIGCAGLGLRNGHDARIESGWTGFADSVIEALGNPDLRRNLGAKARRSAEQRFSWKAIAASAYRSYLHVQSSRSIAGTAGPLHVLSDSRADRD